MWYSGSSSSALRFLDSPCGVVRIDLVRNGRERTGFCEAEVAGAETIELALTSLRGSRGAVVVVAIVGGLFVKCCNWRECDGFVDFLHHDDAV